MRTIDIKKPPFRVSDFVGWQRQGALELSPHFQRRPVWKPEAKSFFIDTVLRGLPAPVIYIRERIDLDRQTTIREIVDGQQRLRTLFTYIDESLVPDFRPERDRFSISPVHNRDVAGKKYNDLPQELKSQILGYEFSTHVLPATIEDREVLQIFARLNATGVKLNHQELRNAEFFGEFKTLMYELALEQLERWRRWQIFSEDQIARMKEVEATSDLIMNMILGLTGKTQKRLKDVYKRFDQSFPHGNEVARRFRRVMDTIEDILGPDLPKTVFSSEVYFYSLFIYFYDRMYGLDKGVDSKAQPSRMLPSIRDCLLRVSTDFRTAEVPDYVLDAVRRASVDTGRRRTRHEYLKDSCGGST